MMLILCLIKIVIGGECMRIEDSAIYYEVRDYFIEIFCPIFSFKDNEDKIISANVRKLILKL